MACVKSFSILLLLSVFCTVNSAKLVYRKYEKKHPKKNYVQVVEIFHTLQSPPHYNTNEKDLNDFLARDAYKSDMNCSKVNESESETFRPPLTKPLTITRPPVTMPVTTTLPTVTLSVTPVSPSIPTTAYRVTNPTTPRYPSTPNLNNLFTIRVTKPTIKPNPRENMNPDYTNLLPAPKPNVQMTKHPHSTMPPTIVIQESDDYPTTNRTSLADIEQDYYSTKKPIFTTTESTATDLFEEDIVYADSGEEPFDDVEDDYNEANYPDVIPTDQVDQIEGSVADSDREEYDEEGGEDYDEQGNKRKRRKIKRVAPLLANT